MNVNTGKTAHKRGQRKNTLDLPQRLLDRLTPAVLETSQSTQQGAVKAPQETLTLSKLFNRYYAARQAAGAAERTLEDYRKHMNWFRRFWHRSTAVWITLYLTVMSFVYGFHQC
ncbi:hypothetical protein F4V43_18605 [Paenibacillus spiritus]|uniref:Uncharacterized protein n=1 Tax=Paenibacillus spiritus TaxID=2496557 RepID=A0A5J5FSH5_9BACL|nr:hypothetical protein [Paenibacillus spiritus]KAA8996322.1 hypothetical protein F4V43_18605 [Paenibacillus spiritus]